MPKDDNVFGAIVPKRPKPRQDSGCVTSKDRPRHACQEGEKSPGRLEETSTAASPPCTGLMNAKAVLWKKSRGFTAGTKPNRVAGAVCAKWPPCILFDTGWGSRWDLPSESFPLRKTRSNYIDHEGNRE